jgi:gliding motility-associated-like protein
MRSIFSLLIIIQVILLSITNCRASHIVGGEVTYKCISDNVYEVTFSIYRDCIGGASQAIAQDNPAFIAIYTLDGNLVGREEITTPNNGSNVPPNFENECVSNPPNVCLNKITFTRRITLNNTSTGYKLVYQRCCRNGNILNVIDPSNKGATYSCIIPPKSVSNCNNSAVFKNFPPQIICVNNPLVYDHSAIDIDGDSLTYEFCQALDGGGTQNDSKPEIPSFASPLLPYRAPYNASIPMGGAPQIRIDRKTGMITGTPTLQGRFVVTVCCNEWRNGVIINTVTREFQFVVTNCSKNVIAEIPQLADDYNTYLINCKDYTVKFINKSTGIITSHWDFGVDGITTDVSDEFEPTFTYPDSGTYLVKLYINKGSTCEDSTSRFVKVYPKLDVQFEAPTFACPGDEILLNDISTSTYPVTSRKWDLGDNTSTDTSPVIKHVYEKGGNYTIQLVVSNTQGCIDTTSKVILIDPFNPNVGNDTMIVKNQSVYFNGAPGVNYLWTPSTYLSDPFISNPIGTYPETGIYEYVVSAENPATGCKATDSIKVEVISNGFFTAPNAFTPNNDGVNDDFKLLIVGFKKINYFRVFGRYGELLFETEDIKKGWDGTYRGKPVPLGTYFWVASGVNFLDQVQLSKGDVIVIR